MKKHVHNEYLTKFPWQHIFLVVVHVRMYDLIHVTVYFVIPIFSFVISYRATCTQVCVCFKGTCSRSPLAAISAGYMCTTNTCVVTGSQKFDNTANSSVATEMKIQIEHQRGLA